VLRLDDMSGTKQSLGQLLFFTYTKNDKEAVKTILYGTGASQ